MRKCNTQLIISVSRGGDHFCQLLTGICCTK